MPQLSFWFLCNTVKLASVQRKWSLAQVYHSYLSLDLFPRSHSDTTMEVFARGVPGLGREGR